MSIARNSSNRAGFVKMETAPRSLAARISAWDVDPVRITTGNLRKSADAVNQITNSTPDSPSKFNSQITAFGKGCIERSLYIPEPRIYAFASLRFLHTEAVQEPRELKASLINAASYALSSITKKTLGCARATSVSYDKQLGATIRKTCSCVPKKPLSFQKYSSCTPGQSPSTQGENVSAPVWQVWIKLRGMGGTRSERRLPLGLIKSAASLPPLLLDAGTSISPNLTYHGFR